MPIELEPPELAQLVDFAERPRVDDWSLRAALVRYASPEPERVAQLVELMRRLEWALKQETKELERDGVAIWARCNDDTAPAPDDDSKVVAVLAATAEIDRLG